MAGRIPQVFIDDLMNRVDIVEVIDSRVPLKKAGREHKACCPFHNEKTASFTVSSAKQFYHCFGCGAHGTAVGFLMDYEHLSFPEAIEELAHSVGLIVPRDAQQGDGSQQSQQRQQKNSLYDLMLAADHYYRQQLRQHPDATQAVDYLKKRGLSGEIAAQFAIGFAPDSWDDLHKLLNQKKYSLTQQIDSGMLIKKDNGKTYDRFRARIMFPIRDSRGRTIGFGGRVLDTNSNSNAAKYLNSPETPLFHKGQQLYGLYEARQALRHIERLLVVEGYMDVVSLAQFDIRYAVATLGTATTHEHLNSLFRLTDEVIFCFDGDRAGRDAAWRALQNALPIMREGYEIRFMFLAEGQDPDSLIRHIGKAAFEHEIANATPFSQYLFNTVSQSLQLQSLDGRAKLINLARPLLAQLPSGVYRQMMLTRLSELSQVNVGDIKLTPQSNSNSDSKYQQTYTRKAIRQASSKASISPLRAAIALLLQKPSLALHAGEIERFAALLLPGSELLMEILAIISANPEIRTGALLERWRGTKNGGHLAKLAAQPALVDENALESEFIGALALLDQQLKEMRSELLLQKSRDGALSEEEKNELKQLLERTRNKDDA